jgi:hypothetical protein
MEPSKPFAGQHQDPNELSKAATTGREIVEKAAWAEHNQLISP